MAIDSELNPTRWTSIGSTDCKLVGSDCLGVGGFIQLMEGIGALRIGPGVHGTGSGRPLDKFETW